MEWGLPHSIQINQIKPECIKWSPETTSKTGRNRKAL
jgi:hypothetical protein